MVFPVVVHGCESWIIKKAEQQRIDTLELWCWRRLKSPLDSKKIKPVDLKENQPWIHIERTDDEAEAEAPILWSTDANSQLIGKDSDARKDWRQKEKKVIEDEMVGWHHQCNGHELGQTAGDGEGQGSLQCAAVHGVMKSQTWHGSWTMTVTLQCIFLLKIDNFFIYLEFRFLPIF